MPSCWICLEEGLDDEGKPLVRDCSCRGDGGYAHLGCLVQYCAQKSQAASADGCARPGAFAKSWAECSFCHQRYQNEVALDLADAFVAFAEGSHDYGREPWRIFKLLDACKIKVETIVMRGPMDLIHNPHLVKDAILYLSKMLSLAEQHKKNVQMKDSWLRMPRTSDEHCAYKRIRLLYEAFGYAQLGMCTTLEGTHAKFEEAEMYTKKAIVIYRLCGAGEQAERLERATAGIGEAIAGGFAKCPPRRTSFTREVHQAIVRRDGADTEIALRSGVSLAEALVESHQRIEAERMAARAVAKSRRVLGPGHNCTREAERVLGRCRERRVCILSSGGSSGPFQFLRHEDGRSKCIVKGPIEHPRTEREERLFRVESGLVIPARGCLVVCHGLKSATHLNGEVGELGKTDGVRCEIHFARKWLKPASIKFENLRIATELPDEE